MSVMYEQSDEQRRAALAKANEVRLARAALKRRLAAGSDEWIDVILDPPDWARNMRVRSLLVSVRSIGVVRADRMLVAAGVHETRRISGLTERQRAILIERREQQRERRRPRGGPEIARLRGENMRLHRQVERLTAQLSDLRSTGRCVPSIGDTPGIAGRVPVAPLVDWINEQRATGASIKFMADTFGVVDTTVHRWLSGELKTVNIDVVDSAFTAMGCPHLLNELWPVDDLEEQAA